MEASNRPSSPRWTRIVGVLSIALIALALLLIAGEMRYSNCIDKAQAEFPASPVSAFNTKTTGPIKLSFVAERKKAVDDCDRF